MGATAAPYARTGRRFILGAMASTRRIWRDELAGGVARRVREKLTPAALIARAPMVASIVLGLAIVAQAADMALTLSGGMTAGAIARANTTLRARTGARHGGALADIVSAHLFGIAPQTMTAAGAEVVSRSPLVLTGIIATPDPHVGFAIIGASAAQSRAIYVGSEAAPGTVLVEVHPRSVVLQRGGERLTLRLTRKNLMAGAGDNDVRRLERSAQLAEAGETDDESNPGEAFAMPAPLAKPPTPDSGVVVRALDLLDTSVQGERGLRISGTGLNHKVLVSLGLEGGDVITQINGIPVGARNAPDLMDAIQAGDATLTVVKNGDASSVTLDPTSVASAAALYRQADPDY